MKNRKLLISILTVLCVCFMSATLFTACGEKHTHAYTAQTTTQASCTEKGVMTYTCSCGDTYTEETPALGHDTKTHEAQAPTCTNKGWSEYVTCKRKGCDYSTYEEILALKHDEKTHQAKAPTCTEIGWEEYVTCEREGCDYSTYKEIPATGEHTWDNGTETKAPTCTKEGETTYTCTVCKTTTKTEPIDKLPHEHNTEKWTSNATYHWHECECGDKDGEAKHTAGAPATATTPQTCTVCGYVLQVETGILFNTLTVNGTNVYGKVNNDTEIFSFINEITVKGDATYVVDVNMSCKDPIESKTVELSVGDNKFYVLEKIGNNVKLFTVTIRRRPMYEVTFNANGGTAVEKQVIEEDYLATEPETTRTGYTFTGWDYDFTQAITQTTKITASWSANTDTKYTVNYYLQNLDDSNYTLHETVEFKGETDTTATAEIKGYKNFTYNESKSEKTISGNINPDGGGILSVYYTRDSYKIVANNNNAKAGTSTQINGEYKYDKQFTLTATTNAGYTWLGWYEGEICVCETEEFTFEAEKDVTYTASWFANKDTKYTVNYYWQNVDDDNYTLHESVELKGETDTTTTAEIREYTHFTYNASNSVISGNVNGDGNQVLHVYYTRNTYNISVDNNTPYGITNSGDYKYGKDITATANPYLGYKFIGWYSGKELLSTDSAYTLIITQNVTAKFEVKEEMSNFNFTSTTISCSIIGLKDKTVTEMAIPNYVTFIAPSAFVYCSSLTNITIPDSVICIGEYAFSGCSSLTSVVIPDSVDSIDNSAFSGCSSLEDITIPFVGVCRRTASDTYQYPFGYIFGTSSYTDSTATTQYYYGSKTNSTTHSTYYIPNSLKKVTVTSGNILYGAFYNCDKLTNVIILDNITSIGESAFYNCNSLTSISIPNSVTSIGESAFEDCNSLTSISIPDSVTYIDDKTFFSCNNLTSVIIGDSVTYIGEHAFSGCSSLTSVVISDSVTHIGFSAFLSCSNLTIVHYKGTASDWAKISIESFSEYLKNATRYYYVENEADVPKDDGNYWHYVDGVPTKW